MRTSFLILCGAISVFGANAAQAQQSWGCGDLENAYGPFDYRDPNPAHRLRQVEAHHFTSKVEMLVSGESGPIGGDIDYILRAFPNHSRALMAMMNLSFKEKTDRPRGTHFTVECYFERAERFQPDDAIVKMLFGIYLSKTGHTDDALKKFQQAAALGGENPNVLYNLGLEYFKLKRYDEALDFAHKAYARGFPLPGLRDMLKRAGRWKDAAPKQVATDQSTPLDPAAKTPPGGP